MVKPPSNQAFGRPITLTSRSPIAVALSVRMHVIRPTIGVAACLARILQPHATPLLPLSAPTQEPSAYGLERRGPLDLARQRACPRLTYNCCRSARAHPYSFPGPISDPPPSFATCRTPPSAHIPAPRTRASVVLVRVVPLPTLGSINPAKTWKQHKTWIELLGLRITRLAALMAANGESSSKGGSRETTLGGVMRAPSSAPDIVVLERIPRDLDLKEDILDPKEDLWLTTSDG